MYMGNVYICIKVLLMEFQIYNVLFIKLSFLYQYGVVLIDKIKRNSEKNKNNF